MSGKKKIYKYKTLRNVAIRLRDDLNDQHFVLLYAFNGTGKTRLSMEFKDRSKKRKKNPETDTLYYNAYTEDLFHWNNDLENDSERHLIINKDSKFFEGFRELALEENIFIWCIFLAIAQLAIDDDEKTGPYKWVKYMYIDDPISSLDDNNAIGVASDLAKLLRKGKEKVKVVISSHHSLFYNVMYNELKKIEHKSHFLHKNGGDGYLLQATEDTPFFHHVALLSELKKAADTETANTYHFNMLRGVLEKTSTFFGFDDFSACIKGVEDEVLFSRALNLLSHGKYSIYQPAEMNDDNKALFKRIVYAFLGKYEFQLPEIFA